MKDDLDKFSTPIPSGLRPLPEAEQEAMRREHLAMMRRLAPKFDDWARTRRRAEVESRSAFLA